MSVMSRRRVCNAFLGRVVFLQKVFGINVSAEIRQVGETVHNFCKLNDKGTTGQELDSNCC